MRKLSWIPAALSACGLLCFLPGHRGGECRQGRSFDDPDIDQSLEWKSAFNPRMSPDGKRVVYEVQKTNWEDNAFDRNLWIVDAATGDSHALTSAKKSSTNAAVVTGWKMDRVPFDGPGQIKDTPEGKKQLYVISADGGEAQQVTKTENDVKCFRMGARLEAHCYSITDPDPRR